LRENGLTGIRQIVRGIAGRVTFNRQIPRSYFHGVIQRQIVAHVNPDPKDACQEQRQHRHHQGELNQGLPIAAGTQKGAQPASGIQCSRARSPWRRGAAKTACEFQSPTVQFAQSFHRLPPYILSIPKNSSVVNVHA
jgi:hypothetical protein